MFKFSKKPNTYGPFDNEEEATMDGFAEEMNDGFGDFDEAPTAPVAPVAPTAPAAAALKIINPKSYQDASEIAGYLMNGSTVLLNIENMAREQAVRMIDYLSGATYVLGGLMTKVGKTTIVVAPKNVDVSSIEAMVGN